MRFIRLTGFTALLLVFFAGAARADVNPQLYEPYQKLLDRFLIEKDLPGGGLVSAFDYRAASNDGNTLKLLSDQREALAGFDPSRLGGKLESVAFWINAYNFFMVNQLLTEQPDGELVASVWDYGGRINPFVDSVFQREKFVVGGEKYSLDHIEKGILLGADYADKGWKDARVHFAVNCAAVGCPPLRQAIYTADNLEDLLAENTRRAFLTDYHLKVEGKILYVTELFKWYEDDFKEAARSRKAFIREWVDSALAERVTQTSSVMFIDYDWSLNKPSNFPEFR
ncbi:DUF547 domain-containing protein [Marinobacter halotolerans]|uniref:DUF547 domain-containing protein n=1 Tax=Marinobacter halotolerans TaxID=1569211 RepID=UPI00124522B6|nr:DUF547 domain-containing protein [Marinobacter halotolerans]